MRPLPARVVPRREQRLRRRVAADALVDVETVRYSVPHRLVRDHVDVIVDDLRVAILHGATVVATHARTREPYARFIDPAHYDGLWRRPETAPEPGTLAPLGRQLTDYAAAIPGGAQ